ncbi:hypothetical protein F2Q69_00057287 [Brassica cretica]|uniref:Uncharacterized protein n=1 Tax=Brassica cretica TaxID=69181 RepID=A0A8S9MQA8_BRACR|nr:hypothetical protein F2Q69_00057287 [Brassica cretica]
MGPPEERCLEMTVSDLLISGSGEWDLQKIQQLLPAYEEAIQCIKPSKTGAPDRIIWLGTKTGEYSVKSGYYSAVDDEDFLPGTLNGGGFS